MITNSESKIKKIESYQVRQPIQNRNQQKFILNFWRIDAAAAEDP